MSDIELGKCQFRDCDNQAKYEAKMELYHTEYLMKMPLCPDHMTLVLQILKGFQR